MRERIVAELTDAALREISRHRVGRTSIDQEVGLWKALSQALAHILAKRQAYLAAPKPHERVDEFVAELTDAAYTLALEYGFRGSFIDVCLGLWKELRRTVREGRRIRAFLHSVYSREEVDAWRLFPRSCCRKHVCSGYFRRASSTFRLKASRHLI